MEKHALNKCFEAFGNRTPTVKLIGTFKDDFQLYFLMELLKPKLELWEYCRTFGFPSQA